MTAPYYTLKGKDFKYDVYEIVTPIGRTHSNPPDKFLSISKAKNISRVHAQIKWYSNEGWFIINKGRNGIVLDNEIFMNKDEKLALYHQTEIKIGDTRFFFLLPELK